MTLDEIEQKICLKNFKNDNDKFYSTNRIINIYKSLLTSKIVSKLGNILTGPMQLVYSYCGFNK